MSPPKGALDAQTFRSSFLYRFDLVSNELWCLVPTVLTQRNAGGVKNVSESLSLSESVSLMSLLCSSGKSASRVSSEHGATTSNKTVPRHSGQLQDSAAGFLAGHHLDIHLSVLLQVATIGIGFPRKKQIGKSPCTWM